MLYHDLERGGGEVSPTNENTHGYDVVTVGVLIA
jgi:hypothetical protein